LRGEEGCFLDAGKAGELLMLKEYEERKDLRRMMEGYGIGRMF